MHPCHLRTSRRVLVRARLSPWQPPSASVARSCRIELPAPDPPSIYVLARIRVCVMRACRQRECRPQEKLVTTVATTVLLKLCRMQGSGLCCTGGRFLSTFISWQKSSQVTCPTGREQCVAFFQHLTLTLLDCATEATQPSASGMSSSRPRASTAQKANWQCRSAASKKSTIQQ